MIHQNGANNARFGVHETGHRALIEAVPPFEDVGFHLHETFDRLLECGAVVVPAQPTHIHCVENQGDERLGKAIEEPVGDRDDRRPEMSGVDVLELFEHGRFGGGPLMSCGD